MPETAALQLIREQFELIAPLLPRHRGNVKLDNFDVFNIILYVGSQRQQVARTAQPLRTMAQHLHAHELLGQGWCARCRVRVPEEAASDADSHRSGELGLDDYEGASGWHGCIEKMAHRPLGYRQVQGWLEHQTSSGCRYCLRRCDVEPDARTGGRRSRGGAKCSLAMTIPM